MSERARYVCVARIDGRDHWFQWETDHDGTWPDRIVLDDAGYVRTFPTEDAARFGCASEPPARYDLDAIDAWCRSAADTTVDCKALLGAWNLLTDLPRDDVFAAADDHATDLYDKLFWGNNLPAMTPPGEHYVPTWSAHELSTLKRVLLLGLSTLRARLR